jgi:CheY-like chemotaxis protein
MQNQSTEQRPMSTSWLWPQDLPKGLKVLVVDDNETAAQTLAVALDVLGQISRVALDGKSAIEVLDQFKPDLVVLDLGMPGMDGLEVAREIRRSAFHADVRLVALTGWGSPEDRKQTRIAGFDRHFTKPIGLDELGLILRETRSRDAA